MTISAMFSGLGIVIMLLGTLIDTVSLSVAAIASMLVLISVIEMKGAYPYLIFAVTAVMSLLFFPVKDTAVYYTCFFGFYPIIKEKLEKLKTPIAYILKVLIFNISMTVIILVSLFLLSVDTEDGGKWMLLLVAVLGNVTFILYDFALTRLITIYLKRLRSKFASIWK